MRYLGIYREVSGDMSMYREVSGGHGKYILKPPDTSRYIVLYLDVVPDSYRYSGIRVRYSQRQGHVVR